MQIVNAMGRVERIRNLIGVRIVNRCSHEAFLFAPQFQQMCSEPGRHRVLRARHTQSGLVRSGACVGDVIGVSIATEYGGRISLYFGHVGIPFSNADPFKAPLNAQTIEHYDFAGEELHVISRYVELVDRQDTAFEMALLGAEFHLDLAR